MQKKILIGIVIIFILLLFIGPTILSYCINFFDKDRLITNKYCSKNNNCCIIDQDCKYTQFSQANMGLCNTPEYVKVVSDAYFNTDKNKRITYPPGTKVKEVNCKCAAFKCVTIN